MIEVGFKNDKGLKRKNNEDAFFVIPDSNIFIVADGVGGNNAGEVASRTTISKIVEFVRNNPINHNFTPDEIEGYFSRCLDKVNKSVHSLSIVQPENFGMATTVTIAYLHEGNAYVINVGDSRAYIFRKGGLTQITEDHTYVNSLIKKGAITKEEARVHEKKNIITRAIGGDITIFPDFFFMELEQDDIIILCTDGIHGELGDDIILEIIEAGGNMPEICANLVYKANQCGGRDNMTVICLKYREDK